MKPADGVAIAGKQVLVTGANRGLGKAFVQHLIDYGADRVYAAARNPDTVFIDDGRVVPIKLDVTDAADIDAAVSECGDVAVLINNAGAMQRSPLLGSQDMSAARIEMDVNYFGTLAMCRAFAPVLAGHGGGALVNVLSVASWLASPFNGSYGASKAAEWALTNAIRVELRSRGVLVVGVHAGWIDTDMAQNVSDAKISAADVVSQTLDAVQHGDEEVLADDRTRGVKAALPHDLTSLYPDLQKSWDAGELPWQN
jgi:NAD(P)-dependent dehydrogenase (short-subunit alcohol dehydrogenase family)